MNPEPPLPHDERAPASPHDLIASGRATLGIELGSTRIKACLIGGDGAEVLAVGSSEWENRFVDRMWTYGLDDVPESAYLVPSLTTVRQDLELVGTEDVRALTARLDGTDHATRSVEPVLKERESTRPC